MISDGASRRKPGALRDGIEERSKALAIAAAIGRHWRSHVLNNASQATPHGQADLACFPVNAWRRAARYRSPAAD